VTIENLIFWFETSSILKIRL